MSYRNSHAPMSWLYGETADGTLVSIYRDPYVNPDELIRIGGKIANPEGRYPISRLRDGGTTTIRTDRGTIHVPMRAGPNGIQRGTPTLDGEPIQISYQ